MKFLRSISWRLQLWHGLLLALVLLGFGGTAWRLERATQLRRVDQELERRVAVVVDALRAPGERPRERAEDLFDGGRGEGYYYVAWDADRRELARSVTAPAEVPCPGRGSEPRFWRSRGSAREYVHFASPPGRQCILVGRDVGGELQGMRRFAALLAGAGWAVFVLGLAGGWWISRRALRPIAEISATASRISTGDLAQRIPVADNGSELDDLARLLNATFARLQASFARQARFTADASHELRTPLSVVLTQAQAALARERPAAEYRDSLLACQNAAQRMRRLIESLLTLARLDSGQAALAGSACRLDRVAEEAVELLRLQAERAGVTLVTNFDPVHCSGSAELLSQVAGNLVGNAIHYNRTGGSVTVRVREEAEDAVLTVADTGEGIAAADLPRVFERFYRADQVRSGAAGHAGLGLAIVEAVVEAHGGSVRVSSVRGEGSEFTVRLPRNLARGFTRP